METQLDAVGGLKLSQQYPPDYGVMQQPRLQGRARSVALIFRVYISLSSYHAQLWAWFECLCVMLQEQDILDILLVYHSLGDPLVSLPELTKKILVMALDPPSYLVMGDFMPRPLRLHDLYGNDGPASLDHSCIHVTEHTSGHRDGGLAVVETNITP